MNRREVARLTDTEVERGFRDRIARDRRLTVELLIFLGEMMHRRLYAPAGCASMYRYCVERCAMSADVAGRWVRSAGPVLRVHQWFRTIELPRDEVDEFAAARASVVRWDIVAQRDERPDLRLWVTRMLPAGRRTRQRWLQELEAWRTWRGGPTSGA